MKLTHRMSPILIGTALLLGASPAAPAQQTLEWAMVDPDCTIPAGTTSFGCGSYGQLLIDSDGGTTGCQVDGTNSEVIEIYPQPRRYVAIPSQPFPTTPGGTLGEARKESPGAEAGSPQPPQSPDPPPEAPVPCEEGSCFSPPGSHGDSPWIAVSDWNNWHGWTVGAAIRNISKVPVSLYALDAPALTQALGEEVGDGHVLSAFCGLVEAIENGDLPRPQVLNLSFGRKAHDTELDPGDRCDRDGISCQIRRVLEHLIDLGTVITGSAGNHGSLLFPSGISSVLAAGALDLAALRFAGEVAPAWESPAGFQALTPGYGICLPFLEGPDAGELWAAPAGSSYASAVLAGWMLDGLVQGTFPQPLPGPVAPRWSDDKGCYVLAHDRMPTCNTGANLLLQQMLGQSPVNCWSQGFEEPFLAVEGPVDPIPGGLEMPSIEEWVATTHTPAPEFDMCVPCVSGGGNELTGLSGLEESKRLSSFGRRTAWAQQLPTSQDLILDVSASGAHQGDEVLDALYLRIQDDYYPLLERSSGHGDELDGLTGGTYRRLVLHHVIDLFPSPATQASLIYVIRPTATSPLQYWTSTPILAVPVGRNLGGRNLGGPI